MSKSKLGLLIPAFCNILGVLMIVCVIGATLPIIIPQWLGFEIFNVETGSMVPEIPIGSAVYVKEAEAQSIRPDDIISFAKEEGTIITHRVVENHVVEGEFITKGDANPQEDIEAVPYDSLVGRVEYHYPLLGSVFVLISSTIGKVYILLFAACGVMLNILAGRMRYARRRKIKEAEREAVRLQKRKEREEELKRQIALEAQRVREAYGLPEDMLQEGEAGEGAEAAANGAEGEGAEAEGTEGTAGEGIVSEGASAETAVGARAETAAGVETETAAGAGAAAAAMAVSGGAAAAAMTVSGGAAAAAMTGEGSSDATGGTDGSDGPGGPDGGSGKGTKGKKKKHRVRTVIMIALLVIFLVAGGLAGSVLLQYRNSDALYAEAAGQYMTVVDARKDDLRAAQIPDYLRNGYQSAKEENGYTLARPAESTVTGGTEGTDGQANAGGPGSTDGSGEGATADGAVTGDGIASDGTVDQTSETPAYEDGSNNYINNDGMIVLRDESLDEPTQVWSEEELAALEQEHEDWGNHAKPPLDVAPETKRQFVKDLDPSLLHEERQYIRSLRLLAPIKVEFAPLLEENEDVKGWIYCDDTNINYPVLHGDTNNTYLRHTYDGNYNIAGSIFIETDNDPEFKDYNTIIYGHHMNDGSMFAGLDQWADQEYYEDHPVMWILTPERDYMVVLVAGQHTSAYSDKYTLFHEADEEFQEYIKKAIEDSDFKTDVDAPMDGHYIMLTTCAYIFDNARYVVHGLLVPADSAGGVPLW